MTAEELIKELEHLGNYEVIVEVRQYGPGGMFAGLEAPAQLVGMAVESERVKIVGCSGRELVKGVAVEKKDKK